MEGSRTGYQIEEIVKHSMTTDTLLFIDPKYSIAELMIYRLPLAGVSHRVLSCLSMAQDHANICISECNDWKLLAERAIVHLHKQRHDVECDDRILQLWTDECIDFFETVPWSATLSSNTAMNVMYVVKGKVASM